jgi:hypothetical protein
MTKPVDAGNRMAPLYVQFLERLVTILQARSWRLAFRFGFRYREGGAQPVCGDLPQ